MTQEYAYGLWVIAAFNVGLFLFFFLSFLPPKGRLEWRNLGIVTAFLVQWPTLLTVLMAPVLVYAYVKLAFSKERYMLDQFGDQYQEYRRRVPAFVLPVAQWRAFLLAEVPDAGNSHVNRL